MEAENGLEERANSSCCFQPVANCVPGAPVFEGVIDLVEIPAQRVPDLVLHVLGRHAADFIQQSLDCAAGSIVLYRQVGPGVALPVPGPAPGQLGCERIQCKDVESTTGW